MEAMPTPTVGFRPPWWLHGPHLQTLWPSLFRPLRRPPLHRERLELSDGDFVDLDWLASPFDPDHAAKPTVMILHGLEGSSRSTYAWGMLNALGARGWNGVVMHFRGCSGEPNLADRRYHSGETGDVAEVATHLLRNHEIAEVAAIGFSLGGNVLLKWLGETGASNPLKCAVAVSVPFLLARCAARLERGFSQFYQWWLMRSMRTSMLAKFSDRENSPLDLDAVRASRTFREFDDRVTAPLHGFADAEDYYQRCSSRSFLRGIGIPTLLIQALDDPFTYSDAVPAQAEIAPCVELETPSGGGHVGFVGGRAPWRAQYWLEERAPHFFSQHFTVSKFRSTPGFESVPNPLSNPKLE